MTRKSRNLSQRGNRFLTQDSDVIITFAKELLNYRVEVLTERLHYTYM